MGADAAITTDIINNMPYVPQLRRIPTTFATAYTRYTFNDDTFTTLYLNSSYLFESCYCELKLYNMLDEIMRQKNLTCENHGYRHRNGLEYKFYDCNNNTVKLTITSVQIVLKNVIFENTIDYYPVINNYIDLRHNNNNFVMARIIYKFDDSENIYHYHITNPTNNDINEIFVDRYVGTTSTFGDHDNYFIDITDAPNININRNIFIMN